MPCLDVEVPAPDGRSHGTLHVPDGDGPWPGVLMYPDAGGVRETFRQMGDHLAGLGNPTYDAEAGARHWAALPQLYQAHLR